MSDFDDLARDLGVDDAVELDDFAALLARSRSAPRASFRGALRRELLARDPGPARPPYLWARVAVLAGTGGALLAVGGLTLGAIGPFAI